VFQLELRPVHPEDQVVLFVCVHTGVAEVDLDVVQVDTPHLPDQLGFFVRGLGFDQRSNYFVTQHHRGPLLGQVSQVHPLARNEPASLAAQVQEGGFVVLPDVDQSLQFLELQYVVVVVFEFRRHGRCSLMSCIFGQYFERQVVVTNVFSKYSGIELIHVFEEVAQVFR